MAVWFRMACHQDGLYRMYDCGGSEGRGRIATPIRDAGQSVLSPRPWGSEPMRQFAAFLILVGLFLVLVGTQFQASDGDKLAAVARLVGARIRNAMPPAREPGRAGGCALPRIADAAGGGGSARLAADKRLANIAITVVVEGGALKLRGVVPDAKTRALIVSLAENTTGVEQVVDELAVPAS